MLDLWWMLITVCSLVWAWCIGVICGRLKTQDGSPPSQLIWRQPRNFARYWRIAASHSWPTAPLFGAGIAFAGFTIGLCMIGIHFLL